MAVTNVWDQVSAKNILGIDGASVPANAQTDTKPGIARAAGPAPTDGAPLWSPDNPLFWFGALAALTFGLVAFSTSVRVGSGRASVSIGKP